jgi:hypothetical protein
LICETCMLSASLRAASPSVKIYLIVRLNVQLDLLPRESSDPTSHASALPLHPPSLPLLKLRTYLINISV